MATASVNGVDINYQFDGPDDANQVVVFSNSLASNLTMWDAQVPALVRAGYRTLRYDTRGHGASASPPGPYSIENLVEDVIGLLDANSLSRVHFCGLSMGGMVAQRLATLYPDRLLSVACCATAAHMNPPGVWDQRIAAVNEGGMEAVVDGTIERWFTPTGLQSLAELIAPVRAGILATSANGFVSCCAAIKTMDQRESIKGISKPAMILVGEEDPGTTVDHAKEIQQGITGSTLVVIPEARHFVNVEQASKFNQALLEHLSRNSA